MPSAKYVIDSCSLIKPYKTIYRMNVVPSFWNTLRDRILSGEIIICEKVYDEICSNRDTLSAWLKSIVDGTTLIVRVDSNILNNVSIIVNKVNNHVPRYKESAISTFNGCADPFVVATAKTLNCSIITEEASAPGSISKIKMPDICIAEGVPYVNICDYLSNENIVL